jgi:hypothetical protein
MRVKRIFDEADWRPECEESLMKTGRDKHSLSLTSGILFILSGVMWFVAAALGGRAVFMGVGFAFLCIGAAFIAKSKNL